MKITITSTTKLVHMTDQAGQGMQARIWEGATDTGIPVICYIPRILPLIPEPLPPAVAEQFAKELQECRTPCAEIQAIPLRLII